MFHIFLLVALMLISGCDQQVKYRVLNFFFTGVPSAADEGAKDANQQENTVVVTEKVEKTMLSAHDFFVGKKCTKCHQSAVIRSFRKPGKIIESNASILARGVTSELRVPLKEICVSCHVNKSASYAAKNGLWLHAPVNKASCTACHYPHQSTNSSLLRHKPEELCVLCHSSGLIRMTKSHQGSNNCIQCHNPHLGKNRNLLIKDHKELKQLPDPSFNFPDR